MAQTVKRLPTIWDPVPFLGWEDPLEEELVTHSSTLGWKIPYTDPGRLQSMGLQSRARLSDITFSLSET